MLIRKTCPGLYETIINSFMAPSKWPLFFSGDMVTFATSKSSELTLSSDLVLNLLTRQLQRESHKCIQARAVVQFPSRET